MQLFCTCQQFKMVQQSKAVKASISSQQLFYVFTSVFFAFHVLFIHWKPVWIEKCCHTHTHTCTLLVIVCDVYSFPLIQDFPPSFLQTARWAVIFIVKTKLILPVLCHQAKVIEQNTHTRTHTHTHTHTHSSFIHVCNPFFVCSWAVHIPFELHIKVKFNIFFLHSQATFWYRYSSRSWYCLWGMDTPPSTGRSQEGLEQGLCICLWLQSLSAWSLKWHSQSFKLFQLHFWHKVWINPTMVFLKELSGLLVPLIISYIPT